MLKLNNINKENFKQNILNNINKNTNLNINTSENSFVNKIMEALSESNEDKINIINELISENDISNLSGKSLDSFFQLFNIKRLKYSDNEFELEFSYYGDYNFIILESTILEFNNENYLITNTVEIEKNDFNIFKIKMKKLNNTNFKLNDYIEINDIKINFDGIKNNIKEKELFKQEIKNKTSLMSFELLETNKETDDNFLNRGSNLFQYMSSDSNFKILNEIKNIENVFDAYFFEEYLTTYIVVIPKSLEYLDNILIYSKEIIDYFKNKNINLLKPNYVNFNIKNIKQFVPTAEYNNINSFIKNYIKNIYLNNNKFIRNDFIFDLTNYFKQLKINNFNYEQIEITYEIFLECDLELLFEKNKIYNNNNKTFEPAIFNCKDVI